MKTLIIKCPDGYDDIATVTLMSVDDASDQQKILVNSTSYAVNLHKYNYLTFDGEGEPIAYWQNGRNDENE
jgi:hypothetical protein